MSESKGTYACSTCGHTKVGVGLIHCPICCQPTLKLVKPPKSEPKKAEVKSPKKGKTK